MWCTKTLVVNTILTSAVKSVHKSKKSTDNGGMYLFLAGTSYWRQTVYLVKKYYARSHRVRLGGFTCCSGMLVFI